MISRRQVLAGAVVGALGLGVALDVLDFAGVKIAVAGLGVLLLALSPELTLRLMLVSISWDLLLAFRVAESATVRIAHVCAAVLFVQWVVRRAREGASLRLTRGAVVPLAFYFGAALVGIALGVGSVKSIGYLGWGIFDALVLFTVISEAGRTEEGFRRVVFWWAAGAALAALFGLVQLGLGMLHLPAPLLSQRMGDVPRINGFNYEPAYFAFYLESVAAVLVGRWLVQPAEGKRGALVGAGLFAAAAISTSRSGWLGLGLVVATAFLWLAVSGRLGQLLRLGAAALVLGAGAWLVLPSDLLERIPQMARKAFDRNDASSTGPRLATMKQAVEIFQRQPMFGVGLGGYSRYVEQHRELEIPGIGQEPGRVVTTNLWLEVAAETGVVGVFALLWFLAGTLAELGRAARRPGAMQGWAAGFLISVVLVFAVLYQFNQTLWRLDVWAMLAMAWSAVALARRHRRKVAGADGTDEASDPAEVASASAIAS